MSRILGPFEDWLERPLRIPRPLGSPGLVALAATRGATSFYSFLWFLLLSRMTPRSLFQRPFDASPDSDTPKNVPFTLVINTL